MKYLSWKPVAAGIFAALLAAFSLQAAPTFSDFEVGDVQVGDKALAKDLEGKVVVVEYWGTR